VIRDIIDLHAVAGSFSYADLESLARQHEPELDLETIPDHLAGVSVFPDEDFAGYGLDESAITSLRRWVTSWYDDLARRLAADTAGHECDDESQSGATASLADGMTAQEAGPTGINQIHG
jgi:hypothetical protein